MKSRKGTSWITFNRVIKEGKESLKNWISNVDADIVADYIVKLSFNNKVKKGFSEIDDIYDLIKYRGLNIDIKRSTLKEYPTRLKSWTFSFINLYDFDYTIFAGYDGVNKKITYWLIESSDLSLIAPFKRDAQTMNGKKMFSIGISENKNTPNWIKYEKHIISKNDLISFLNKK
jgi:hypothetical protein